MRTFLGVLHKIKTDFGIARCRHSQVLSTGWERARGGALGQMKLSVVFIDFSSLACILYSNEYVWRNCEQYSCSAILFITMLPASTNWKRPIAKQSIKVSSFNLCVTCKLGIQFTISFWFRVRCYTQNQPLFHFGHLEVEDVPFSFSWM